MQMKPRLLSDFLAFATRTFSEFISPKNCRARGGGRTVGFSKALPRAEELPHRPKNRAERGGELRQARLQRGMPTRDPFPAGQRRPPQPEGAPARRCPPALRGRGRSGLGLRAPS